MLLDLRSSPYPADFPVIREPGMFKGWALTAEFNTGVYSVVVPRYATRQELADALRLLIEASESDDES